MKSRENSLESHIHVRFCASAKRTCGADSPSGATIAVREAEEAEACSSRARSTRARRLSLGSGPDG